jgi:hypothetical protein
LEPVLDGTTRDQHRLVYLDEAHLHEDANPAAWTTWRVASLSFKAASLKTPSLLPIASR